MDTGDRRLLATLRGAVEAPADVVATVLLDAAPGGRSPLRPHGEAQAPVGDSERFSVRVSEPSGSTVTVHVDRPARMVALQGGWWYRSETTVSADGSRSLVTQQIFDVATRLRWAVRFVSRQPLRGRHAAFGAILDRLGERLGARAYPLS